MLAERRSQATSRRARAHVDLGAIERNARRLAGCAAPGAILCAVVKADGYGHGASAAARAALAGGASWLAVATADEAVALRRELPVSPILVLGALDGPDLARALHAGADVVAWTPEFVRRAAALAGDDEARLHVKADTGMGRLGARSRADVVALAALADATGGVRLRGAMTHFATADAADEHFAVQLASFSAIAQELRARHPGILVHAANSAAALRAPAAHFDMVRCGVALYGLDPFQRDPAALQLEPALELRSYVARVARLRAGDAVGYGAGFRASAPTSIATVPIGYADGVRRTATGATEVLIGGRRRRLAGTVSMDSLGVDVGRGGDVRVGDEVVLIGARGGERILAEELAASHGTINYEIVCALGSRVERVYHRSPPAAADRV